MSESPAPQYVDHERDNYTTEHSGDYFSGADDYATTESTAFKNTSAAEEQWIQESAERLTRNQSEMMKEVLNLGDRLELLRSGTDIEVAL